MGQLVAGAQKIVHPSGDPSLPSFVHPALAEVSKDLELVRDCWELLHDAKEKYLPRELAEPLKAYQGRVTRSKYPSFFRDGIVGFAGALSRWTIRSAPNGFLESQNDIDGNGKSLKAFTMLADQLVLRDAGVLLMVDMPQDMPESRTAERQSGRRPILRMAERGNVLNWRTKIVGGRELPVACTVREFHEVEDGNYGVKIETRYRVMRGNQWALVRLKMNGRKYVPEIVKNGNFSGSKGQLLNRLPVIWYGASMDDGFGRGDLPLLSHAELTLAWFRKDSDQEELLHKCALPVGVRKGMAIAAAMGPSGGKSPPVSIGPNSILDLPENASFEWQEINGSSLQRREESLRALEQLMDRQTLAFLLSGNRGADRTATESLLASAQITASLAGIAEAKQSVMQSVMELWSEFSGESLPDNAGIEMARGLVEKPVDPDMLRVATDMFDKILLRRESVVGLAARAGLLPEGVTAEDEAKALDDIERLRDGEEGATTPDPNDPAGWMDVPANG